jgi:DNA-binding response OmpR family regulator
VIMVTGNYVSADVEAARRVDADDYLVKPFDTLVLLDKAKTLLGRGDRRTNPSWWPLRRRSPQPLTHPLRSRLRSTTAPAADAAHSDARVGSTRIVLGRALRQGCAARFGLTVMCEGTGCPPIRTL